MAENTLEGHFLFKYGQKYTPLWHDRQVGGHFLFNLSENTLSFGTGVGHFLFKYVRHYALAQWTGRRPFSNMAKNTRRPFLFKYGWKYTRLLHGGQVGGHFLFKYGRNHYALAP